MARPAEVIDGLATHWKSEFEPLGDQARTAG
jgi:hypothetical protein